MDILYNKFLSNLLIVAIHWSQKYNFYVIHIHVSWQLHPFTFPITLHVGKEGLVVSNSLSSWLIVFWIYFSVFATRWVED